ncbi:MAG: hypothetical protein DMF90_18895, partial [Acidobacteria bacterium]
ASMPKQWQPRSRTSLVLATGATPSIGRVTSGAAIESNQALVAETSLDVPMALEFEKACLT